MALATLRELEEYLGGSLPEGASRLLDQASRLIDNKIFAPYSVDVSGVATETVVRDALRDAACAQVEWWIETGDQIGITEAGPTSIGDLSVPKLPRLAPVAREILQSNGLLYRGVGAR